MRVSFYVEYHKQAINAGVRETDYFTVDCGREPSIQWPWGFAKNDATDEEILAYVQKIMKKNEWELLVSIDRIETETREVPIS